MARRLQTLACEVLQRNTQAHTTGCMMPAREEELVFSRWASTAAPYSTAATACSLFEELTQQSLVGKVAIGFAGECLGYQELEHRTSKLAATLHAGTQGNSWSELVVGLCLEKSVEEIVGIVGIMRACMAYMPLDPNLPGRRIRCMIHLCKCKTIVAQRQSIDTWRGDAAVLTEQGNDVVVVVAEDVLVTPMGAAVAGCSVLPGNLAYVLFTSGSTGTPKVRETRMRRLPV